MTLRKKMEEAAFWDGYVCLHCASTASQEEVEEGEEGICPHCEHNALVSASHMLKYLEQVEADED